MRIKRSQPSTNWYYRDCNHNFEMGRYEHYVEILAVALVPLPGYIVARLVSPEFGLLWIAANAISCVAFAAYVYVRALIRISIRLTDNALEIRNMWSTHLVDLRVPFGLRVIRGRSVSLIEVCERGGRPVVVEAVSPLDARAFLNNLSFNSNAVWDPDFDWLDEFSQVAHNHWWKRMTRRY